MATTLSPRIHSGDPRSSGFQLFIYRLASWNLQETMCFFTVFTLQNSLFPSMFPPKSASSPTRFTSTEAVFGAIGWPFKIRELHRRTSRGDGSLCRWILHLWLCYDHHCTYQSFYLTCFFVLTKSNRISIRCTDEYICLNKLGLSHSMCSFQQIQQITDQNPNLCRLDSQVVHRNIPSSHGKTNLSSIFRGLAPTRMP